MNQHLNQAPPAQPAGKAHREGCEDRAWRGFRVVQVAGLAAPLIIVKAEGGMLACGYISTDTCDKLKEACAIVTGVKSPEDMLVARVARVSAAAAQMGCVVGMSGADALKVLGTPSAQAVAQAGPKGHVGARL